MSNEATGRSDAARQVAPTSQRDSQTLVRELRDALRAFQRAVDAFDEAVSERLGINRTDLRCLDLLEQHRPMTAGALAEASGITTGAMTFVLDRLEGAGFVRRQRDEGDRRRVLVDLEPEGADRAWSVHEPLVLDARHAASGFDLDELDVVRRFLQVMGNLYDIHREVLRSRS